MKKSTTVWLILSGIVLQLLLSALLLGPLLYFTSHTVHDAAWKYVAENEAILQQAGKPDSLMRDRRYAPRETSASNEWVYTYFLFTEDDRSYFLYLTATKTDGEWKILRHEIGDEIVSVNAQLPEERLGRYAAQNGSTLELTEKRIVYQGANGGWTIISDYEDLVQTTGDAYEIPGNTAFDHSIVRIVFRSHNAVEYYVGGKLLNTFYKENAA